MKTTLYHRTSTGAVKVWRIWTNPSLRELHREWGILDGEIQHTVDVIRGTNRHSDVERLELRRQRYIEKKMDEGYVADLDKVRQSNRIGKDLDWLTLPPSFAPAKPITSINPGEARNLERKDELIIQRKRDGQRIFVLVTKKGDVKLYSRKMEDLTEHMPRLRKYLEGMSFEPRSILDGELIVDRDGKDDFRAVGQITRSLPERAQVMERKLPVKLMLFDMLYYKEVATYKYPYEQRYTLLKRLWPHKIDKMVFVAPSMICSLEQAQKYAKEQRWEGLVLWHSSECSVIRMDGKTERCNCYKWKPVQENDFVATGYRLGTGKNRKVVGALELAQYVNGKLVPVGRVGSGFDDETREEALHWKYPCVVQVEYDKQEEDSGKLRFPTFIRKRDDKHPKECVR